MKLLNLLGLSTALCSAILLSACDTAQTQNASVISARGIVTVKDAGDNSNISIGPMSRIDNLVFYNDNKAGMMSLTVSGNQHVIFKIKKDELEIDGDEALVSGIRTSAQDSGQNVAVAVDHVNDDIQDYDQNRTQSCSVVVGVKEVCEGKQGEKPVCHRVEITRNGSKQVLVHVHNRVSTYHVTLTSDDASAEVVLGTSYKTSSERVVSESACNLY